jgi:3'-5' exoribonuclease
VIKDFYNGLQVPFIFCIIQDVQIKTTTTGKLYMSAKLTDKSGTIDAKYWDYDGDFLPTDSGKIVKVAGAVSDYKGALQFTINKLRLSIDTDNYNKADLVPCAPIDIRETVQALEQTFGCIVDDDYRNVCMKLWETYKESFVDFPAAKGVHHAFIGGLLMHTYNMMKVAGTLAAIYKNEVNHDLLLAGTFLHDIAKIHEYETSELGLATDFTLQGNMLGHLVIGANVVGDMCDCVAMSVDKKLLLQNMLLSHHGKPEFGAAVVPRTLEAELLHMIDLIDSRVEICREAFENTEVGQFTEKIFALDNKQIYRHF